LKVGVQPRLDDVDARQLSDMKASAPFGVYRKRVEAELERVRELCERNDGAMDIHRAQGMVAALRTVLALPDRLITEAKSAK
jgi:hypothetical protein